MCNIVTIPEFLSPKFYLRRKEKECSVKISLPGTSNITFFKVKQHKIKRIIYLIYIKYVDYWISNSFCIKVLLLIKTI